MELVSRVSDEVAEETTYNVGEAAFAQGADAGGGNPILIHDRAECRFRVFSLVAKTRYSPENILEIRFVWLNERPTRRPGMLDLARVTIRREAID